MSRGWNNWYHVIINTYGSWLPGDSRGWRERGHKLHVPGDYKSPPPDGFGKGLESYARSVMVGKKMQVRPSDYSEVAARLLESFQIRGVEIICWAVSKEHAHLLGRFAKPGEVKREVGHAKRHVAYHWTGDGPFWAKGCSVHPVADREHQVRVFEYIERHWGQGAFVWTFRDGAMDHPLD